MWRSLTALRHFNTFALVATQSPCYRYFVTGEGIT